MVTVEKIHKFSLRFIQRLYNNKLDYNNDHQLYHTYLYSNSLEIMETKN